MGTEHNQEKQNREEIYPGKLRRGGTCDPNGVDIFTIHHKEYGRQVYGHGEASSDKKFASPFNHKIKFSHTPHRKSKYDDGQEIQPGLLSSRNVQGRKNLGL